MPLRPFTLPSYVRNEQHEPDWFLQNIDSIHLDLKGLQSENPDVSVIIPAYNEEDSILRTLSSLSKSKTTQRVEILVVDNNSSDRTAELVKKSGAIYLFEQNQGVKHART